MVMEALSFLGIGICAGIAILAVLLALASNSYPDEETAKEALSRALNLFIWSLVAWLAVSWAYTSFLAAMSFFGWSL